MHIFHEEKDILVVIFGLLTNFDIFEQHVDSYEFNQAQKDKECAKEHENINGLK